MHAKRIVGEVFLAGKESINNIFWSVDKAQQEVRTPFTLEKDKSNLERAHRGAVRTTGGDMMDRVLYEKAL